MMPLPFRRCLTPVGRSTSAGARRRPVGRGAPGIDRDIGPELRDLGVPVGEDTNELETRPMDRLPILGE